jgi:hypothetical protein
MDTHLRRNNTESEDEVDSFMDEIDHHFNNPGSHRDYSSSSSLRQTNLNQGQGRQQALDLAQSHTVRADSASSTHTRREEDVLESRGRVSAAAITSSSTNKDKGYDTGMMDEEEDKGGTTNNDITMSSVDGISSPNLHSRPSQDPLG